MTATPDPTQRFSSRVANYVRYRPSYPPEAIALLGERCGLRRGAQVADLGSGTGILTRLLLEAGARVAGVEPNDGMRGAAEADLGSHPHFTSIRGTAEATTLAPASVDLIVAGQAFHWFRIPEARREALRILRPGAHAALLWNEHPARGSEFLMDYEALVRRHAPEYDEVVGSRADGRAMHEFLGRAPQLVTFPNRQEFDFEGLKGRLMSSSYAPEPGHPEHEPLMRGLRQVFDRHARAGRVTFPYQTLVYFAPLEAAL
ncbi:MAG: class I SAM-dependent methyltransferase [Proteobacteria bacterium]|nr:class I SAM-dependent methyltransferase [Pseudomonadota bacterium]